jgi:hypothetical protein
MYINGLRVSPVLSISVLVEEWITLLTSDPVLKELVHIINLNKTVYLIMTILFFYSALPAGSEPLLAGMSPWLVWADLPELLMFEKILYILNDFYSTLLRIY